MVQFLLSSFAPMLLGAQLVLTLVLVKGDICPGQRGRIHKLLPAIGLMWMAVSSIEIAAFLVVFAIFYFYSKVQTGKTRDAGPLWVLYLADGLAVSFVAIQAMKQPMWGAVCGDGDDGGTAWRGVCALVVSDCSLTFASLPPHFAV